MELTMFVSLQPALMNSLFFYYTQLIFLVETHRIGADQWRLYRIVRRSQWHYYRGG